MKRNRAFLGGVLKTVRYPLVLVDGKGRVEMASHAAADLLDVLPGAIRGMSIGEVAGSHGTLLHDAVTSALASGAPHTTELQIRGRSFDVMIEPVRTTDVDEATGAVIHVTQRSMLPLEGSAFGPAGDRLWLILNQLPHAVYWKDRHSRYLGGNRIFAEVVGLASFQAVPGITDYDIMEKSDAEAVRREDEHVMTTGKVLLSVEQPLRLANGGAVIEKLKVPLCSESGETIGILCVARDVTEQKRAEARLLSDKLAAEQASRAKTSLFAAASHDLRQPVQALALFAKLLGNRVDDPGAKNLVKLIQQSVLSLANLLEAVIHLSKLDAGVIEPDIRRTAVGELLERLGDEFSPRLPRRIWKSSSSGPA